MKRIVLTGGPGSGKTFITTELARRHPDQFIAIPEAATQVYSILNTRWDKLDIPGRRDVQRRIYVLQIEQEDRAGQDHPGKTLLLDRGTIDGAAYWPDGPDNYWREVGTTLAREIARYDKVIWLESCAAIGLYEQIAPHACRHEDPAAALANGQRVLRVWKRHPRLHHVVACDDIERKIAAVESIIFDD